MLTLTSPFESRLDFGFRSAPAWSAVGILHFGAVCLGLTWAQWGTASPIWPATGIGVAAVFYLGQRIWPALLLGALAGNLIMGAHPVAALAAALGSAAEALAIWHLYQRFAHGAAPLADVRTTLHFVQASLIGPIASASLGATALWITGGIPASLYIGVWLTWWLANVCGALVVGAAFLAWWPATGKGEWRGGNLEFFLLLTLVMLVGYLAFGPGGPGDLGYPVEFLPLPVLFWAVLRFGLRGVALCHVALAIWAMGASVSGYGVFAHWPGMTGYWLLLVYILVGGSPLLGASALARENESKRRAMERARNLFGKNLAGSMPAKERTLAHLTEHQDRLDRAISHLPIGIWAVNPFGRVSLARGLGLELDGQALLKSGGVAFEDLYAGEPDLRSHIRAALEGETRSEKLEARGRKVLAFGQPMRDLTGKHEGAVGMLLALDRKMDILGITPAAGRDPLTGLLERQAFTDHVAAAVERAQREHLRLVLLRLDCIGGPLDLRLDPPSDARPSGQAQRLDQRSARR
jgi:integral membrane sensor domain MASE1